MLKGFKLKKDSNYAKGRITSADISGPTPEGLTHMNRLRSSSNASSRGAKNSSSLTSTLTEVPTILKALYSYHAQSPGELSFSKGEYFQFIGEDGEWYEVNNPENAKRGMVPKNYFEPYSKSRVVSSQSILASPQQLQQQLKAGSLYAIVLYDFKAEKSDELTVFAGENLFICAHHNYEWFITKPIGRLGGPGLVPVGFVTIIDIDTGYATGCDVKDDIDSVNLPTVQEWKSNIAKYKASNISLGSVDHNNSHSNGNQSGPMYFAPQSFEALVVTYAAVDSFTLEGEKYWFHVICDLEDGRRHSLKRYYEDFYDLQVQLLDSFPEEAGKLRDSSGQWTKRIMPYIPGPVPYVTNSITKKRKDDLNIYVKELIALPPRISQANLVKSLFAIRNNGFDREVPREVPQTSNSNNKDTERLVESTLQTPKLKNVQQDESTLTASDTKIHDKMESLTLNDEHSSVRPTSSSVTSPVSPSKPTKVKFYYKDDIFALLLPSSITFAELHQKIAPRIDTEAFHMYIKVGEEMGAEITSNEQVSDLIREKLKITVLDAV
ncbi:HDR060Cp [Eremothecium sinecaudum]|uniref:HDR060Cp n=1 Tax=Eremothecium sinecaudum TaxID=45286 RepID=A0A0X8HST5_9SACH|nr:HDR060Cp [Eremothecium sinecaudum]AMD20802.1 HDR060Cp [Eremothecium sinecaudum]